MESLQLYWSARKAMWKNCISWRVPGGQPWGERVLAALQRLRTALLGSYMRKTTRILIRRLNIGQPWPLSSWSSYVENIRNFALPQCDLGRQNAAHFEIYSRAKADAEFNLWKGIKWLQWITLHLESTKTFLSAILSINQTEKSISVKSCFIWRCLKKKVFLTFN